MAYVKIAPFAVFLLAAFLMFSMKKIEGAKCGEACDTQFNFCNAGDGCRCFITDAYLTLPGFCAQLTSIEKKVEELPNLCWSHAECIRKGSGNYCAHLPNSDIKYGFCFASISEAEDVLLKRDFLKMSVSA
ncbi:putative albumin I chain a [Medicago truncatula]|uniref:Albumin I n=1 Tax=Medicago truncatula TaxID=3880 RepID=I3S3Q2_MEDTR|nr:albumin-1 [Medicago truncatula]AFK34894.1 unknown [Medicago truncatula]KEH34653.1 albumin I [Medicago truncatula]RHN68198.1 putative albumin I chain a [Medicago truncatula]